MDSTFLKTYELPFPLGIVFDAWISDTTVIPPASRMRVEPRVGGVYRLEMPDGSCMNGIFSAFIPGRLLRYSWRWGEEPESTQVEIRFSETPSGCSVVVEHSGFESSESLENHARGWDGYISGLVAHLGS